MSNGKRLGYWDAKYKAETLMIVLQPHCQAMELAGSLRRQKDVVNDIEIVIIPNQQMDLFGNKYYLVEPIRQALLANSYVIVKGGDRYIQATRLGVQYDIFIASLETFGCVFMIRTGSAAFSRRMVTPKRHGGYCPDELYFQDGRLWRCGNDKPLNTPTERDVFDALGIDWISPEKREV